MKGFFSLFMILALAAPLALAQTIIVIHETELTDNYDQNYLDALNSVGVTTCDGITVPGLGYTLVEYDDDEYTVDTFTSADGDLILILESSISGDILAHANDPLPLVNMESLIMDSDASRDGVMYWHDGSGDNDITGLTGLTLTNNTHSITSIFALGELAMWCLDTPLAAGTWDNETNGLDGAVAPGLTMLGSDGGEPPTFAFGVAETGTILTSTAPGDFSPTPARRAYIGINGEVFQNVTAAGVVLYQRTIQWALGLEPTAVVPGTEPEEPEVEVLSIVPSSLYAIAGDEGFTLTAPGSGKATGPYQWYMDGTMIVGAINRVLEVPFGGASLSLDDAGMYRVTFDDESGKAEASVYYDLFVYPAGSIVPLTGLLGLGLLAGACALGGAAVLRRKK